MKWLRNVIGLSPRRLVFVSRLVHERCIAHKATPGQVFHWVFRSSLVSIIPLRLSVLIYHIRDKKTGSLVAAVNKHILTPSAWTNFVRSHFLCLLKSALTDSKVQWYRFRLNLNSLKSFETLIDFRKGRPESWQKIFQTRRLVTSFLYFGHAR